ncbi:MAG: glycine betaine ABC transporter substrate-binding protein [Andreesenia angusta]|nr:glycine betaine ABC transporter substrate-binding protein [Andreesenia angusta]
MFKKKSLLLLLLALLISFAIGCKDGKKGEKELTVGSKEFTENILLGKITKQYLENLGYKIKDETGLSGQALIRESIKSGEVDLYWEYTGSAYMGFMKKEIIGIDPEDVYKEVKEWDEKENDIIWLRHSDLNNSYAFLTTPEVSNKTGIKTISDLAEAYNKGENLKFIANPEYFERKDGMKQVYKAYDFEIDEKQKVLLELGLFYDALINKEGDFTIGFTTDGMIDAKELVVLEDDKSVFPVYYATPCIRGDILEANPELEGQIDKLIDLVDTETIMKLNKEVDINKKTIEEVAEEFLKDNNLI